MSTPGDNPPPIHFTLRALLIATAIVAVVVAAGVKGKQAHDKAQRRAEQQARISRIPAAMDRIHFSILWTYHGAHKKNEESPYTRPWPPTVPLASGKQLYSWRFPVIVMSDQCGCEKEEDEPDLEAAWNAPRNIHYAIEESNGSMFCLGAARSDSQAHVFGVTGPHTAFDPTAVSNYADLPDQIIVAMEIRDSNTQCIEPGDYDVAKLLAYTGKLGDHLHGLLDDRFHILFADGEVWALDPQCPIANLQPFLTIPEAKTHDRDSLLAPYRIKLPTPTLATEP